MRFPLNLQKWISENRHTLKPPVSNKLIWEDGEFMVFIVAGPNGRTDFHINNGEEFFYQIEGDIFLKTWKNDRFEDVWIREGDIYLLPKGLPHSPQRPANTLGLVIERQRLEGEQDGLMWRCPQCTAKMYEEYFHLTNIVTQFKPVFERFFASDLATCKSCGYTLTQQSSFLEEAHR